MLFNVIPDDLQQRRHTLMYSTKRFKNATKCSAFLILPGIASLSRSFGRTTRHCQMRTQTRFENVRGLPMNPSVSFWSDIDSCRPSTSLAYSSCSFAASVVLILNRCSGRRPHVEHNILTPQSCQRAWSRCGLQHPSWVG